MPPAILPRHAARLTATLPGLALLLAGFAAVGAHAAEPKEPCRPLLQSLLTTHHRVIAAEQDLKAAGAGQDKARAGWYPELQATYGAGREIIRNPVGTIKDTHMAARQAGLTLTQPLLDFGRIGGDVDKATLARRQAEVKLDATRQDLLLEGLTACINASRADSLLDFAGQSVRNVETQTGLEQEKVDIGAGLTSDVLQAKSQLAGARARLVRAKGAQASAINRFRALFLRNPGRLQTVPMPAGVLPHSQDEAVTLGLQRNLQFQAQRLGVDMAGAEVDRVRGVELFPKVDAIASTAFKHDVQGISGNKREDSFRVQLSMPFNLGLGGVSAVEAAEAAAAAARRRQDETALTIEEKIRNAWEALDTARLNAEHLHNQEVIVGEFLRLAREERLAGRRSLLEILSGETSLINARSDAASAEADVVIAAYALLQVVGALDLETVP